MSSSSRRSGAALLGAAAASLLAASVAQATAPELYEPYATPASARTSTPVVFEGGGYDQDGSETLSFAWDFAGGTAFGAFSAESVEHTFATDGLHALAVRGRDDQGETADLRITYATHPDNWNPVVEIDETSYRSQLTETATRFGQYLSLHLVHDDSPRAGVSATWDLDGDGAYGDGDSVEDRPLDRIAHFTTDGEHPVRAKVTDGQGGETIVNATVRTHTANEAPVITSYSDGQAILAANLGQSYTMLHVGVEEDYSDRSALTFAWKLDGVEQTEKTPHFTVPAGTSVGEHTAEVTVTDDGAGPDGAVGEARSSTKAVKFQVVTAYPAHLSAFSSLVHTDGGDRFRTLENIRLYAYQGSDKHATAYDWDLDADGQYDDATGYGTSFAFPNKGTYTVAARVTLSEGAPLVLTRQIVVDAGQDYAPVAPPVVPPANGNGDGGTHRPPTLTPEQVRAAMVAFLSGEAAAFLQGVAKANKKGISAARPVLSLGTLGPDQLPNGGTGRFDVYDKPSGRAAAASAKRKKLGSTTVTLAKGARKAVQVKLNAKGKALLRKKGKVKLTIDAALADALTGAKAATSRTYTFKVAKKKRR